MSQGDFTYRYEFEPQPLEVPVQIGVRTDPSIHNVESFAVLLFFELRDGTRVEIAKIDDSPHDEGDVHIDRYYRELGAEVKDFDIDVSGYLDAEAYLQEHGVRLAQLYKEHHGNIPREDRANV